jgi:hypothetical protein
MRPTALRAARRTLDPSNTVANNGAVPSDVPYAPPIVALSDTTIGHLLAWELMEIDGTWRAWVSWIQQSGGRPLHKVVSVRASGLRPLEEPESYERVPRWVRGRDGVIRPWSGEIP